jgi:hypothetical protein
MKWIIAGLASLFAVSGFAAPTASDYYKISTVKTELLQSGPSTQQELMDLNPGNCGGALKAQGDQVIFDLSIGAVSVIVDQVINVGKKIWDIVQAGKPVMNMQFDVATALPQGTQCWIQLENWKTPISQVYRVSATNGYGFNVVTFDYRVLYIYGGSYKGQGNYIGYATTQPANVSVAWGFTLNAKGSVPVVMNAGTAAAPVGAMQLNMNYTISTAIGTTEQTQAYYINGLGDFKILN